MSDEIEGTPSLYAKLAAVMHEIGYVKKAGYNSFHNYSYTTEADLVDAVREKLAARNVVVIPSLSGIDERGVTNAKGKASTITTARVAFTFCDGDSGQTHTAEWAGAGDDPADKGLYKAYTGAVKYFLMKSFLIPTGDDPEADEGTDKRSADGQSSPPRYQRPPETRDVKTTGKSDVPAESDPWFEQVRPSLKGIPKEGLAAAVKSAGGTVPEHVSSWARVICALDQQQREKFVVALDELSGMPWSEPENPSEIPGQITIDEVKT